MLAILAILIYLWFRFEWQFALGAMIANVHDIVLTIGFMSITQIDFDLTSIAALLTILGYSLNDTVVIYDRIREMLRRYRKLPMPELLNASVNQTLSRSVITHVTVSLALLALLLFGGQAIHSFTATMMFGVVLVGTYTSVFIASPILIYLGVGTGRDALTAPDEEVDGSRRPRRCSASAVPFAIDAYGEGGFRFAGMSHRGSLLCFPDGIWAWPVNGYRRTEQTRCRRPLTVRKASIFSSSAPAAIRGYCRSVCANDFANCRFPLMRWRPVRRCGLTIFCWRKTGGSVRDSLQSPDLRARIARMQDHLQHCAALVREADRDRYLATLFAPAQARCAVCPLCV